MHLGLLLCMRSPMVSLKHLSLLTHELFVKPGGLGKLGCTQLTKQVWFAPTITSAFATKFTDGAAKEVCSHVVWGGIFHMQAYLIRCLTFAHLCLSTSKVLKPFRAVP